MRRAERLRMIALYLRRHHFVLAMKDVQGLLRYD